MVWYGMVWYGMVWYGMVWYGMVWYSIVWYGMVGLGRVWRAWCVVNIYTCVTPTLINNTSLTLTWKKVVPMLFKSKREFPPNFASTATSLFVVDLYVCQSTMLNAPSFLPKTT